MKNKKMTVFTLALMGITSVFGFTNIPRSYYMMGYAAIIWYVIAAVVFLVPYAFIIAEYGAAFKNEDGGIFVWMEKSVGTKFAFICVFMWYANWLIWMLDICGSIWIYLSTTIFGTDTTAHWSLFGLKSSSTLSLLGILFMIIATLIAQNGMEKITKFTSIGGFAAALLTILAFAGAIIALVVHHGQLAQPLTAQALLQSPNPDYANPVAVISFAAFAIFAYGGIEVVGGVSNQMKHPEKDFSRGVMLCSVFILIAYSIGLVFLGFFVNWQHILSGQSVNLQNTTIIVMNNLGYSIGEGLGLSSSACISLGTWIGHIVGLALLLTYLGAFLTVTYLPVKQVIESVPERFWPSKIGKMKNGIPRNAMWIQCAVVICFLFLMIFQSSATNSFFNNLVLMTTLAAAIPYALIAIAFHKFEKNQSIHKPVRLFKKYSIAFVWSVICAISVTFAIVFSVLKPILQGNMQQAIWMVAGPIFFTIIALLVYRRYEKLPEVKLEQPIPKATASTLEQPETDEIKP